ncbi:helix-turn-helix domain-containing protein [Nocardia wallacei]|uniref:helix-turn-helix domain-containing protein n=1 Tax=Nocardia wallacei TaxID=480035 RepID=UPI0024565392|nr:helix-turn-helix domain-containing protein [Nocardia wallacei]
MKDVLYLDRLEQAEALLKPQRLDILRALAEPSTCRDIAVQLEQTPQRVNYHVKKLLEHGIVRLLAERQVRGTREGVYQAVARSYWLSPQLVGTVGERSVSDAMGLGHLLDLTEEVQRDVAAVDRTVTDLPSIGISGQIHIRPDQRAQFLDELSRSLQDIFTRYGGRDGDRFKLAVACYPFGKEPHD